MWLALFIVGAAVVALVVALLRVRPQGDNQRVAAISARARAVQGALLDTLPGWAAALGVLLAGTAATIAVFWPLGSIFKVLEPRVDLPLFRFAQARQGHATWTAINELFTQMGNRPQVKVVCVIAALVLGVLWRKRAWWVPVVVIAAAFGFEKYSQAILGKVVARGHPPTTLGTYPSGGCARILAIYGIILYLVVITPRDSVRAGRLWLFGGLSMAAYIEGYTRIFLLEHWFTDVVGGWIFGSALLGVLVAATATLARSVPINRPANANNAPRPVAVGSHLRKTRS